MRRNGNAVRFRLHSSFLLRAERKNLNDLVLVFTDFGDYKFISLPVALNLPDDRDKMLLLFSGSLILGNDDFRQTAGRKTEPLAVFGFHNDRKRNAISMIERHFPSVAIAKMLEYDGLNIESFLFVSVRRAA